MKRHDIETYSKLAEGARFFLEQSFHHVYDALKNEHYSIKFKELIMDIDPNEDDFKLTSNVEVSENAIDLLQNKIDDVLSKETIDKFRGVMNVANEYSEWNKHKFPLSHKIQSIEILSHINNLGFFIETLTNRHLLFLHQSNKIDEFSYNRINIAKIMERLIYIFKEELITNKCHLNEITNLFSLRNKTVHFTPDNSIALKPQISELIQIWTQCSKIIEKFEKIEKFNEPKFSIEIKEFIKVFKSDWT